MSPLLSTCCYHPAFVVVVELRFVGTTVTVTAGTVTAPLSARAAWRHSRVTTADTGEARQSRGS